MSSMESDKHESQATEQFPKRECFEAKVFMENNQLTDQADELLNAFIKNARKRMESPHPSEWEFFYSFVNYCHDKGMKFSEHDLIPILRRNGFEEQYVLDIADVYRHIRAFMKGLKKRPYKRMLRMKSAMKMIAQQDSETN